MTSESSDQSSTDASVPLTYATPALVQPSPTRAAAVVGFIGLSLIVLGGCFLIPVSVPLLNNQAGPGNFQWDGVKIGVMVLLIAIAFVCFSFAALLIFLSVRRLLAVMRG